MYTFINGFFTILESPLFRPLWGGFGAVCAFLFVLGVFHTPNTRE